MDGQEVLEELSTDSSESGFPLHDLKSNQQSLTTDGSPNFVKEVLKTEKTSTLQDTTASNQMQRSPSIDMLYSKQLKISSNSKALFGGFLGVFIPVFINMVCVTFFMDLHSVIKIDGWLVSLFFFTISFFLSCITLCNICVIATNGKMEDGGCYYLVSRTLGPELGGATGLTLSIAHATSISWRLHHVASAITYFYGQKALTKSLRWDRTLWHFILSLIVFFSGLLGIKKVVYILLILGIFLIIGVLSLYFGFFIKSSKSPSFFTGIHLSTYVENISPMIRFSWSFINSLGILFPTSNAVMTCANFSGILKDSSKAIPQSAFSAFFVGAIIFGLLIFLEGGAINYKDSSITNDNLHFLPFEISSCSILTEIAFIASCIGSSITMTTGGARILNRMTIDQLLPSFFRKWTFNGEFIIPHILITFVTLIFSFVNDPNTSTKITNIVFLIPFSLINYTVFMADSAHYPGFRPSFYFFNRWIALMCALICIIRAFLIDWIIALIADFCFVIILLFWHWRRHRNQFVDPWGTVTQSRTYYATLQEELNLYHIKANVKAYRPNILFATTLHPDQKRREIDFIQYLLHGFGMAAVGRIFIHSVPEELRHFELQDTISFDEEILQKMFEERFGTFLVSHGYRTFYDTTIAPTFHLGVRDLILMMGIGIMRPNILCLDFPEGWLTKEETDISAEEFVKSFVIASECSFGIMSMRNVQEFEKMTSEQKSGTIDVWWPINDGGLTVLLSYILSKHKDWKKAKLRIITIAFADQGDSINDKADDLMQFLYKARIFADAVTISTDLARDSPSEIVQQKWDSIAQRFSFSQQLLDNMVVKKDVLMADLIRQFSQSSSFVICTMPLLRKNENYLLYMARMELLSDIGIPFCFVKGNGQSTLSWKL